MKKFITMALLAAATTAMADDFQYMTFAYNGIEKSISLESIQKITFTGGNVVVTTSDGQETFAQSQMEKMFFSATATDIKEVENSKLNIESSDVVYDLSGRRVEKATKGIYIIDGKKVVVK